MSWKMENLDAKLQQRLRAQLAVDKFVAGGGPVHLRGMATGKRFEASASTGNATPIHGGTYSVALVLAWFENQRLPRPEVEYKFSETRKYRFDFAWPDSKLYLEVNGGIFTRRAHGSISGILHDIERQNYATCLGWRPLIVIPASLMTVKTAQMIQTALSTPI